MGEPHFFKKNDVKRYWAGTWMGGGVHPTLEIYFRKDNGAACPCKQFYRDTPTKKNYL
jgi:hypothetical protein